MIINDNQQFVGDVYTHLLVNFGAAADSAHPEVMALGLGYKTDRIMTQVILTNEASEHLYHVLRRHFSNEAPNHMTY